MANFDDLPSVRARKPVPARDAPTPAKPTRPAFEFSSPEDTPKGVRYRKTADGFVASAPASTLIMALLLGLSTFGLGYVLWRASAMDGVQPSFFLAIGVVDTVFLLFFLYFAFGRIRVAAVKDKLVITKTVFGIGFPRRFNLLKIERMKIKSRSGVRGLGWGGTGMAEVKDQVCEIETDKEIRLFGAHLQQKHLYYVRYLVIHRIKELKGIVSEVKV